MEDGTAISGDEASAWLREHFGGRPEPRIRITWTAEPEESDDDGTLNELLALLFGDGPHAPDQGA
ncbi:hypothetical protein [Streptomyces sp. NBC_00829]|uniref:hypothetical protein n=1 Tax=Streptomyces sp. NBC_00829 TaxID=2903679 RepID=UPI00386CE11E|nr:hypothetical protein OG293_27855 [Streptomyces sp. NBC_00829]